MLLRLRCGAILSEPSPAGKSTPMPSVMLNLPPHVVAKPRRDGTFNMLFVVRRDRPKGWPKTIPLPKKGPRNGNLNDRREVARILAEVEGKDGLLARLDRARAKAPVAAAANTLPGVLEHLTGASAETRRYDVVPASASETWKDLRPRSRASYVYQFRPIEAWSEAAGHPAIAKLTLPDILAFLDLYNDRPSQKASLKRTFSVIFSHALRMGVRKDHPFGVTLRLRRSKSARRRAVVRWDRVCVETYQQAALGAQIVPRRTGWLGGAILIGLMWETSADASDCITWTRQSHFVDDPKRPAIAYARGKTDKDAPALKTPISTALADLIRSSASFHLVTDPYGRPYPADDMKGDTKRGYHFRRLKALVIADGGPDRLLDHLRHSAATDAVENGASLEATRTLTRHKNTSVLDSVYVQLSEAQTEAVQRARGIIE
jgi:integrase